MPTQSLSDLRTAIRARAGHSITAGHAAQNDAILTNIINQVQRQLALEYQFPELHLEQDVTLAAGDNTYAFPSDIGINGTMDVWCEWGSEWRPVTHGIGALEQSIYSDTQQSWPIRKWEVRVSDTDDSLTLYVWPTPSQAGKLRFSGQKTPVDMSADSDRSTLDGTLLTLQTAGLLLARQGAQDAQLTLSEAQRLAANLVHRQSVTKRPVNTGRRVQMHRRPYLDFIPPES